MGMKKNGFTIVELLIVVVVIAILAAITVVAYNGISNQAKDSAVKTVVEGVDKQLAINESTADAGAKIIAKKYYSWGGIEELADTRAAFIQANQLDSLKDKICIYKYDVTDPDYPAGSNSSWSNVWADRATSCGSPYNQGDIPVWDKTKVYMAAWGDAVVVSYWSYKENTWMTRYSYDGNWSKVEDIDGYHDKACAPFESHVMGQLQFDTQCRFVDWYAE